VAVNDRGSTSCRASRGISIDRRRGEFGVLGAPQETTPGLSRMPPRRHRVPSVFDGLGIVQAVACDVRGRLGRRCPLWLGSIMESSNPSLATVMVVDMPRDALMPAEGFDAVVTIKPMEVPGKNLGPRKGPHPTSSVVPSPIRIGDNRAVCILSDGLGKGALLLTVRVGSVEASVDACEVAS
jgi:hypothetical protein